MSCPLASCRQLPEHILQDPAVVVVRQLGGRVDAAGYPKGGYLPFVARGGDLQLLAYAQAVATPLMS